VCGRFTLSRPAEVAAEFGLPDVPELPPRYNIAPTQPVVVVREIATLGRVLETRLWGLVPHFARDPRAGARLINARAETAAERPSFREAFRRRRCLVPADGFYEWGTRGGERLPFHVAPAGPGLFAFAGLFEHWEGPGGAVVDSCTILTTRANARVAVLHDRMPVIVERPHHARWLDPSLHDPEPLRALLEPLPDDRIVIRPASPRVNDVRNDDPACLTPPRSAQLGLRFG
jgi:putative SOS response-associated peptidase YedK